MMGIKIEDHCDEGAGVGNGDGWGDGWDEGVGFLDDYTFGTGSGYCGYRAVVQIANGKGYGDGTGVG